MFFFFQKCIADQIEGNTNNGADDKQHFFSGGAGSNGQTVEGFFFSDVSTNS